MSTSENADLKPNSIVPISNFDALFSLNPPNAFTILRNTSSFDAPCRIETAYETPPVLANLIANSSVITGDSPFEIVTDISNQNSVLQLISGCDLSIVKTEVETVENFENNPCNSNIDQNASQTKTLSTVTRNTEIQGVGDEGFPKRNEHLENLDTLNPSIPGCASSDQVKGPCLSAKSVLKPVQRVNATAKSVVRIAEDSSSKDNGTSYQGVKDSNSRNQHIVVSEEVTKNLSAKAANLKSVLKPVQQVNATAKSVVRIAEDSISKGNDTSYQGVKDSNSRNQHIVVSEVVTKNLSAKAANLKSVLKPVQQVNAIAKSVIRIAEDSSSKGNGTSYKAVKDSNSRNQHIVVPEEVTKNFELLKGYFVGNKCLICGFVSKHLRSGYRHMVVHMTVKPFQCEQCPKAFATERGLTSHQLSHTDKSKLSKFTCSTCGKCFERQSYLKSHENRHVPVIRYKCEICQKGFSLMAQLRRHARTHTGEKPFVCNVCGDSFVKSCSFKQHINIHTKEVAYTCDVCQKVFYSSNYFKMHMRAHGQGDVFQCDVCNATFNFKSNLAQHKLTHSENRSHKCNECGKTFKLPHHLRQHLQTHNSDSASSKKRKTPQSKRVKYNYSDDEDFILPDEDYVLADVKDVNIFPVIKEEN